MHNYVLSQIGLLCHDGHYLKVRVHDDGSSTQTQLISEVAGEVMTITSHSYSCVCSIFHVVCTSRRGRGGGGVLSSVGGFFVYCR